MTTGQKELPSGWKWVKLGDVCDFQNGFAFKSALFKENKDETSVTFNMEISVKDRNIVGTKIGTIVWIVVSLIFFSGVGYIALRIRNSTAKLR